MRSRLTGIGRLILAGVVIAVAVVVAATLAWRLMQPPVTALQLVRLGQGYGFERSVLATDALPAHLGQALIAAEDNRFCRHGGVDWRAFAEQVARFRAGERPRGASTITMQLTKNLYLWPHRSNVRKALELALAPLVDLLLPKRRQLALYLNQVEFAPGVYGVEAGARRHFGKGAAALTAREGALLVALLPAPLVLRPRDDRARAQASRIEMRIRQLGPLLDCAR